MSNEPITNQNTTQQPNNDPTPGASGGQGSEKMFSQEDVNRIVSDRLAKERAKLGSPTEREQELNARESRLSCREYLMESKAPAVLLDVLDTSDLEKFKEAVAKLQEAGLQFGNYTPSGRPMRTSMNHQNHTEVGGGIDDQIADAFKPKRR